MAEHVSIQMQVFDSKNQSEVALGQICRWTSKERNLRALKVGGGTWLLALVSVVIPVLHFILVPLFFLLGPVLYWMTYKKSEKIEFLDVKCPQCAKLHRLENLTSGRTSFENCPSCQVRWRLEPR